MREEGLAMEREAGRLSALYRCSSMRGGKARFDGVVPLRRMLLRGWVGVLARARRTWDGDTVLGGTEMRQTLGQTET